MQHSDHDVLHVEVGDVLVVGAGASGLIAARLLSRHGYSVTLIDSGQIAGEQSNHSHGYLHRGHIYQKPRESLVRALTEGASRWEREFSSCGISPLSSTAFVAFGNKCNADLASATWSKLGLRFAEAQPIPVLNKHALPYCFRTEEATYEFTRWYEHVLSDFYGTVNVLHMEAVSLQRIGQTIAGVYARSGGSLMFLRARFVVLTAGTGNLELVATATSYRGRAINRLSFMLVLADKGLPCISFVSPENPTYGLFLVSRHTEDMNYWLASNFVSYANTECSPDAVALWVRGLALSLRRYTSVLSEFSPRWGVYLAPKGELRMDRNQLSTHAIESYGIDNLCVAAPTKLTLAFLLGDQIYQRVCKTILPRGKVELRHQKLECKLTASNERWKSVPLRPYRDLVELLISPKGGADILADLR